MNTNMSSSRRQKILVCGPIAPPYGGVSVHIDRLVERLRSEDRDFDFCDEARSIKCDVFNLRSLDLPNYLKLVRRADLVHIHSGTNSLRLFHLLVAKLLRKNAVLSVHAWPYRNLHSRIMTHLFSMLSTRIVYVSKEIREQFRKDGPVLHAFIPPVKSLENEVPEKVVRWLARQRESGKKIAVSNAFRLEVHNAEDLYGLDLCIDALAQARVRNQCSMIFVVSDVSRYPDRFAEFVRRIEALQLQDSFLLWPGYFPYSGLLQLCDVSVRATNTDGDSLSIRESLHLRKLTIASDAVERPEGVILFSSRSGASLGDALMLACAPQTERTSYEFGESDHVTVSSIKSLYQEISV